MILLVKWRVLPLNGLTKKLPVHPLNPVAMHPDAPYFSILLCLTPDDFTCQAESAATQQVNQKTSCASS
jgi:hypothetical protein